jgi:uncharacterized protein (DUF58 family)
MSERLFDEATLRKLNRLTLVASKVRAGVMKGERRSARRGTSLEFADYRNYTRGDDLRRVDWNVFARLERPFIKLFEEEEDLSVYLIIDASASMNWPQDGTEPGSHKFRFAQHVMAALGYIALGTGDFLSVTALTGGNQFLTWGPYRGRGRSLELLDFIGELAPLGRVDLNAALRDYALRTARAGLCLIVSDLLSPDGFQDGLAALQNVGHEIGLIHVLSPDEVDPPLAGDLQLIDVETDAAQDVTVDAAMRDLYIDRLLTWRDAIARYCLRRAIHYATVESSTSWEALILFELRRMGLIR